MLILLLLVALIRTLRGVPLSSPVAEPDSFSDLNLRDTQGRFGQRTVNDIIISCFATIFACTWTAIHPNIPAPMDCWWTRFKRQVVTMGSALVAPEFITLWAIRQRLGAKYIMDEYNKEILGVLETGHPIFDQIRVIPHAIRGLFHDSPIPPLPLSENGPQWTLTHGFFLQMGGFMLSDRGKPLYTLFCSKTDNDPLFPIPADEKLIYNIKNSIIDPPRITEADIQDRSKGDAISKTFIILQTSWFIVQCIARWAQHLPVTELEIITLGFAMLNGITCALWWNKPQNVGRPVFLECKTQQSITKNTVEYASGFPPTFPKGSDEVSISDTLHAESEPILSHSIPRKKSYFRKTLEEFMEEKPNWMILIFGPFALLFASLRSLGKLTSNRTITPRDHRVPMFYAAYTDAGHVSAQFRTTIPIIGVIFGFVHLIPSWFLDFSSHQEMWLWRISSLLIIAVPVLFPIFTVLCAVFDEKSILFIETIFGLLTSISAILYTFARIILLILSLTSLRSLSAEALQTIEWTTFIPHL